MAERENFSFNTGELGILSTEELVEAGESFLNSDPNDIKFVGNRKNKDNDDEEEEVEEEKPKEKKKVPPKVKEVKTTPKEVKDILSIMEGDKEEEETNQEEEEKPSLNKKKDGQKTPEKKEEKTDEEDEEEDNDDEGNPYSIIAKELVNHGVFIPQVDEAGNPVDINIKTPEELLERFQLDSRKAAGQTIDRYLSRFGEEYVDMFTNVFEKGVPPIEYLNRYTKIESIKDLDLTNEDNQERIVRELYRTEGRSAEYIDKKMLQHKNYNDLADEATEAQKVLIQKETTAIEQAAAAKQAEIQRKQQIRNEYVSSMNRIISEKMKAKEFDGIPVDPKFAEKIYGYITQIKFQTKDKEELTEFDKDIIDLARPENHELKVKIAMLLQLAKEDPKLTKLAKKAVSKETNKLFEGLQKQGVKTKKQPVEETSKEDNWFK